MCCEPTPYYTDHGCPTFPEDGGEGLAQGLG